MLHGRVLYPPGFIVIMKKKKPTIVKYTKETPEARKERVSSGVRFRAAVFENKKKKLRDKITDDGEL